LAQIEAYLLVGGMSSSRWTLQRHLAVH